MSAAASAAVVGADSSKRRRLDAEPQLRCGMCGKTPEDLLRFIMGTSLEDCPNEGLAGVLGGVRNSSAVP